MAKTTLDTEPPPPFNTPAEASHRHILRALKSMSATEEHPKTFRTNKTDKSKGTQGKWTDKFKKKAQCKQQRIMEDVWHGNLPMKEASLDRNAVWAYGA